MDDNLDHILPLLDCIFTLCPSFTIDKKTLANFEDKQRQLNNEGNLMQSLTGKYDQFSEKKQLFEICMREYIECATRQKNSKINGIYSSLKVNHKSYGTLL